MPVRVWGQSQKVQGEDVMSNRPKQQLPILVIGADYVQHGSRIPDASAGTLKWLSQSCAQFAMIRMPCPYCGEIWNLHSTEFEINLAEHIARNHQ